MVVCVLCFDYIFTLVPLSNSEVSKTGKKIKNKRERERMATIKLLQTNRR